MDASAQSTDTHKSKAVTEPQGQALFAGLCFLMLRGMAMGVADVVPGVSGGLSRL